MLKWILVMMLLVVLTVAPATADNLFTEIDDIVIRGVETSVLIGNVGFAAGAYWPVGCITQFEVTFGPMGAIGNEALLGGAGAQLPMDITIMGLPLPIDFGFGGWYYNWKDSRDGFAAGVGKTFEMEF